MKRLAVLLLLLILVLSACAPQNGSSGNAPENNTAPGNDAAPAAYKQITQEQAKEMMARDDGHIIVDVRRQDEYDEGHIPGAVLIP
ncbi:MAG: rhodanese-like domain-containing protein, partial [Firmicutes bacterium]|nr:rhodanese-like domain-containing protein [Bacillota bacterium]